MRIGPVSRLILPAAVALVPWFTISCTCACKSKPPATSAAQTPATSGAKVAPAPAKASIAWPWTWSVDAGGQPITHTVDFKQDGEKLTGKFTDSFDNTTYDIQDGKIHDGNVSFTVVRPFMDNGNITLKFDGKFDGTAITGKMDITIADQTTTSDWNAKRGTGA